MPPRVAPNEPKKTSRKLYEPRRDDGFFEGFSKFLGFSDRNGRLRCRGRVAALSAATEVPVFIQSCCIFLKDSRYDEPRRVGIV